ncbi:conserved hypothetical protein [Verrucomicrobia bacterium]|nr:conserved hypothetical protein [Verrucomicrobiota bacterium]
MNPSILPDLNYYEPGVTANVTGNPGNPNFQTFCVEGSEYIYQNRTYDVTLQQSSLYGGLLGPKALTVGAALLYYDFAKGLFTGAGGVPSYNYLNTAGGRTGDAGKLQDAIWWLMGGQESQTYNSVNTYEHWINGLLGVHAFDANSSLAHPIDVSVLSLWEHGGAYTTAGADQDQLILTGNQGYSPVPDGGTTVALLGLAMSGLGFFSRKLRK